MKTRYKIIIAAIVIAFSGSSLFFYLMDISAASDDIAKAKSDSDRAIMVEKYGYELTNSLAIRNDARDSMLAQGYQLYPGGWLHRDRIQADISWMEHPNGSGELILDGYTMKKQYDDKVIVEIVFGDVLKGCTVYPGGAGCHPSQNFTVSRIYNQAAFGTASLNFTAMLNDKIFVDKCVSNGGVWDYTYYDCVDLSVDCSNVNGVVIDRSNRVSCVFPYEN